MALNLHWITFHMQKLSNSSLWRAAASLCCSNEDAVAAVKRGPGRRGGGGKWGEKWLQESRKMGLLSGVRCQCSSQKSEMKWWEQFFLASKLVVCPPDWHSLSVTLRSLLWWQRWNVEFSLLISFECLEQELEAKLFNSSSCFTLIQEDQLIFPRFLFFFSSFSSSFKLF